MPGIPRRRSGARLRRGLTPITLGLMLASGWILMRAVNHDWRGYLLTLLTVGLVLRTPWNPLWLTAAGALVGMAESRLSAPAPRGRGPSWPSLHVLKCVARHY